jgi:hypothetical protein
MSNIYIYMNKSNHFAAVNSVKVARCSPILGYEINGVFVKGGTK